MSPKATRPLLYVACLLVLSAEGAVLRSNVKAPPSARADSAKQCFDFCGPKPVVGATSALNTSANALVDIALPKMRLTSNHSQDMVHDANMTLKANADHKMLSPSFVTCHINPNGCMVDVQRVSQELNGQILLLFGCSLDIYALDYFCKAANAPITGFSKGSGDKAYTPGNLAYCQIGGFTLAFSFHPGVSGPPYFGACESVLKVASCMQVASATLIQQSIARVMQTFGKPPTSIIVDSSLWDVAAWYLRDGSPKEPYVAPAAHINHWCLASFPALVSAVQLASPYSKVAFRSAPRVEFMAGYGHSMENINAINNCYKSHQQTPGDPLSLFQMIDYHYIVETLIASQGGSAVPFYDDAFHPGVLPSMVYVDWVMQWMKSLR